MSNRTDRAHEFYINAKARNENAGKLFYIQTANDCELFSKPYANKDWHKDALWHPFYHATKFLFDIARLAGGLGLFFEAYIANDGHSKLLLSTGLTIQCNNLMLDFVNGVVSTISLIARTVASIIDGYPANGIKASVRQEVASVFGDNFLTKGLAAGVGFFAGGAAACAQGATVESEISERTYRF